MRNQCARALDPPGASPAGIILGRIFRTAPKLSRLEHVPPGADGWCNTGEDGPVYECLYDDGETIDHTEEELRIALRKE